MKQFLLLLSLALAGLSARGQQPTFQERVYRLDSKFKFMCSSDMDRQGNLIFSGLLFPPGSSDLYNSMILLVKPNMDTLWTRRGSDVPGSNFYAGAKTRINGSYAFASSIKKSTVPPPPPDNYDGVLQHYSPAGSRLLNKALNPNSNDNGINNFLPLPDKGYLINGWESINGSGFSLVLTRTDSAGNVLWQRNHSNISPDYGLIYMEHAGNGGAVMAGIAYTGAKFSSPVKIKLLLTDANGNAVHSNSLNLTDPGRDEGMIRPATYQCLVKLADGSFLITGKVDSIDAQTSNYTSLGFVAKVNASLQLVWKYIHRPAVLANSIHFTKAKELKDGSIMVLGQNQAVVTSSSVAVDNFALYRFSSTGKLMATYPFTSNLYPSLQLNTMEALPDSSFLIGGRCRTAGNAQTGFYLAKVKIPNLPAGYPSTILATADERPMASASLGAAYPNPAQGQVYIPYSLPVGSRLAQVVLRDITGREVGRYSIKQQKQGNLPVNTSKLPHGFYLYTLEVDGRTVATKKLAVMK